MSEKLFAKYHLINKYIYYVIFLLLLLRYESFVNASLPEYIKIGGIFESGDDELENAFKHAVDRVNNDRTLLPRAKLVARIEKIKPHDSFHAAKLICNSLIQEGVWALLGSQSPSVGWLLRSLANNLHVPHLSVFWDYRSYHISRTNLYDSNASNFTLSLYPEASLLSKAFMDLVLSRHWKSFTLIFEENDGLIKLKDLLRISSYSEMKKVKMSILQYDPNYQYDPHFQYKKLLKDIKKSEHNIILSVSNDKVIQILKQASQMQRLTEYDNYLIATLDIHTLNLSEFHYTKTNITGLTMLDPEGQDIGILTRDWIWGKPHSIVKKVLPTTTALVYDAVTLFARALDDFQRTQQSIFMSPIDCESKDPWPYGTPLINFMKASTFKGLTGTLKFDGNGQRTDFTLDILELKKSGFVNVAKWTRDGIISTKNYTSEYKDILENMKNKEMIVTVLKTSKPYIYLKDDHEKYEGNDKFDGFCVDLLNEIAKVVENNFDSKFKYRLKVVADGQYGNPDKETGEWNGMIGELMKHQADLAIADLTATYKRETAVDFTMPFMNLGIAILFKKPGLPEAELFSFLKPFSAEVWLYLASAYLGISLLLWILSRISPYEWVSGHPCDPEPEELENQFSIGNSLWFTIGSLMQQGSDLAPRALSTRTLASIWWFFTLIMISSYTANLAASLTLTRMSPSITSVEDLAKQTAILYGCRKSGSTYDFFQNSNHSTFQRMFNTMESNPEVYIDKTDSAIERVRKGGYAYLMESSTIEYETKRQCDLIQIGSWLDNKGYGIATPADSPYRTIISNAIVVLQDGGILYDLKNRWWVDKGGGVCADEPKIAAASELNIENVGGVFVVLISGVGIGCAFAALEFIWKSMKLARHERESIGKLIWLEVVRIFTGGGSTRPIPNNNNTKSSIDSDSVRELESMADINNKNMARLTPNSTRNQPFFI